MRKYKMLYILPNYYDIISFISTILVFFYIFMPDLPNKEHRVIKLTPNERKILAVAEFRADSSVPELARLCGLREHVVRYALKSMQELGVIGRPEPFVNLYRLGFLEVQPYFSAAEISIGAQKRFMQKLLKLPRLAWIMQTSGDFQFRGGAIISELYQLFQLVDEIHEISGGVIFQRSLLHRRSYFSFPRKYLTGSSSSDCEFSYGIDNSPVDKNSLNLRLLDALIQKKCPTLQELAQLLKLPVTTVDRHKKALERAIVIEGYFYRIDPEALGMRSARILLSVRGNSPQLRIKLLEFARQNIWITYMAESMGDIDYTLAVDVPNLTTISDLCSEILLRFRENITNTSTLIVYRYLKQGQYRFA